MSRLEGKVAVVTGAGRGIGRSEALLFAEQGAKVVVNDLGGGPTGGGQNPNIAQDVVDTIRSRGGEAVVDTSDVSTWAGGELVVRTAINCFGRIDILSNNAGIARVARVDEITEADWSLVTGVNLTGYASTIRHAAPHMISGGGGVIINKGSTAGFGQYSNAPYSAAKEGVVGLSRTVARDLGQFGVRCNVIRPGTATSNMGTSAMLESLAHSEGLGIPMNWNRPSGLPSATLPLPDHVAALTVFLCLETSAQVNGREFFVTGAEVGIFPEPQLERNIFAKDGWDLEGLCAGPVSAYLIADCVNRFDGKRSSLDNGWLKHALQLQ